MLVFEMLMYVVGSLYGYRLVSYEILLFSSNWKVRIHGNDQMRERARESFVQVEMVLVDKISPCNHLDRESTA